MFRLLGGAEAEIGSGVRDPPGCERMQLPSGETVAALGEMVRVPEDESLASISDLYAVSAPPVCYCRKR